MRLVSRDFTLIEKCVLLVLSIILIAIGYYRLIDQPVRQGISEAEAQCAKLQEELDAVNARISDYELRVSEVDEARELRHYMPSYNASDEELRILNDVLGMASMYSVNVEKITLSEPTAGGGNQIRRNFQFSFQSPDFELVKGIFTRLSNSRLRCMIGNVEYGGLTVTPDGSSVSVRANGAFYETLIDAQMDAVLGEVMQEQGRSEIPTSNPPEKAAQDAAAA